MAFFSPTPAQTTQVPRFNPQQMGALNQILQMGQQGLQNANFDFSPIEQQARSDFQSKTVPSIAERFSSLGSGSQGSSAFQGALGAAGSNLERDLAAMKAQYGLQQQGNLMNLLNLGLQPQFESLYQPEEPSGIAGIGHTALQLLPLLLAGSAGGAGSGIMALLNMLPNLLSSLKGRGGGSIGAQIPAQGSAQQLGMMRNLGMLQ